MEITTVNAWLYSVLSGDPALQGLIGNRIYEQPAPEEAEYPMIVFQAQAPADVNSLQGYRVMSGGVWLVRAVGECTSYEPLREIADRIDALLHKASGEAPGMGTVLSCVREAPFAMVETDNERQYRHLGGLYRVLAQG
jgi:hypothetical protein